MAYCTSSCLSRCSVPQVLGADGLLYQSIEDLVADSYCIAATTSNCSRLCLRRCSVLQVLGADELLHQSIEDLVADPLCILARLSACSSCHPYIFMPEMLQCAAGARCRWAAVPEH